MRVPRQTHHRFSRQMRGERQTFRSMSRSRSGALLAVKCLARFEQPHHAATGERYNHNRGVGWEYLRVVTDDHSRLAYGGRIHVTGPSRGCSLVR